MVIGWRTQGIPAFSGQEGDPHTHYLPVKYFRKNESQGIDGGAHTSGGACDLIPCKVNNVTGA